ncbi:hypothetical protein EDB80DRAFT_742501 [Ilyonectria destructans]|nr:hypothetical protein EDB80DRAFT_742501 [Ilyonectria destructans]
MGESSLTRYLTVGLINLYLLHSIHASKTSHEELYQRLALGTDFQYLRLGQSSRQWPSPPQTRQRPDFNLASWPLRIVFSDAIQSRYV